MSEDNGTTIETKWGKISGKKTSELIAVLALVVTALIGYVVHEHRNEAKAGQEKIDTAIDGLASSQKFFACIISQPQEKRLEQFENPGSFCNRFSK